MNEFINSYIAKITNTTKIEYPKIVLGSFLNYKPIYQDYGQFSGGLITVRYERRGIIYEFIIEDDTIVEATQYPEQFLKI